jgi:hypothetical protein
MSEVGPERLEQFLEPALLALRSFRLGFLVG